MKNTVLFSYAVALGLGLMAVPTHAGTFTFPGGSSPTDDGDLTFVVAVDTTITGDAVLSLSDLGGDFGDVAERLEVVIDGVNVGTIFTGSGALGDCRNYGDPTLTIPQATLEPLIADGSVTIVLDGIGNNLRCGAAGHVFGGPSNVSLAISGGALAFVSGPSDEETATATHLAQTTSLLLNLQPDLRNRVSPPLASVQAQVTQGVGFVTMDTGGGPVWASLQAERQEAGTSSTFGALASLGLQWDTGPRSAVGGLLQFDTSRSQSGAGVETATRGFLLGGYTVQHMGGLTFDARLLAGRGVTDVTSGANTATGVSGTRVLGTVQLAGRHALANGQDLRPFASLEYAQQSLEAYTIGATNVGAASQTLGEAALGLDWDLPVEMQNGLGVFTLGASAQYAFQQTGAAVLPSAARGRVHLGWAYASGEGGATLSAGAYLDGLGAATYQAVGANLNLSLDF